MSAIKSNWPAWASESSKSSRDVLRRAYETNRPVVFLLGAGMSSDSGIPLASQLSQYLVQVWAMIKAQGFSSTRQYIEEMGWPSRHDLRLELMLQYRKPSLNASLKNDERLVSQASLVSELRKASPTLAFSLDEIFGQLRDRQWNAKELSTEFGELKPLASGLAKRVPRNVAYRSLLFHLCENSQALIDGCLDHFIRDRSPTTTHQFIVFFSKLFRSQVILSTNFDSLLERAFGVEGVVPRVYEIQGEGSLPSARMLLSQQYSIVKLHGGAHQMRTGFDLDEPLTPTVLASFYELFDRLEERSGQPPLMLVMGYGGSDRRVMDIVGTVIKRWEQGRKQKTDPCVLWIARDPWVPELLKSAVTTHPQVLYRQSNSTDVSHAAESFPAHLVHYQEGRLFLLEHYQDIAGDFPISQLNYQAVNFVPHGRAREENKKAAELLSNPDSRWSIAMIAAEIGGGSSSQLAKLAGDLDLRYRVIWIDLAEVPSVSSLVDVLAERLAKYDHRLQSPKRPPLLQNTLYGECESIINRDGRYANSALDQTESWELKVVRRWFTHALRRGEYLILFDSMDEFPGRHRAIPDDKSLDRLHNKEKALLVAFVAAMMTRASEIGDSKIAIATKYSHTDEQTRRTDSTLRSYPDLQEYIRRKAGAEPDRFQFIHLPGVRIHDPKPNAMDLLKKSCESAVKHFSEKSDASRNEAAISTVTTLVLTVACCCRRIRSEQLLTKSTGRLFDAMSTENAVQQFLSLIDQDGPKLSLPEVFARLLWSNREEQSPRSKGSRLPDEHDRLVRDVIHFLSGDLGESLGLLEIGGDLSRERKEAPRWFYRLEGAYHWMHAEFRDSLYEAMQEASPLLVALSHHRIAEFCIDDLYSRSKDARAFLEYIFHRIAAIRNLSTSITKADLQMGKAVVHLSSATINQELSIEWIERLSLAILKERDVLLARARVPSLIAQLRSILRIIANDVYPGIANVDALVQRLRKATCRLLSVVADLLLAAGHSHSAVQFQIARVRLLTSEVKEIPELFKVIYRPGSSLFSIRVIENSVLKKLRSIETAIKEDGFFDKVENNKLETISSLSDLLQAIADSHCGVVSDDDLLKSDWCEQVWYGNDTSGNSRQARLLLLSMHDSSGRSKSIRGLLRFFQERVFEIMRQGLPVSSEVVDLARRIFKRDLELILLNCRPAIEQTIQLYMRETGLAGDAWNRSTASPEDESRFRIHVVRSTSTSARHECYRLCLRACYLAGTKDPNEWDAIWSLFLDAEAVLNRQGGPADLQALAITRVMHAEHLITAAEFCHLKLIQSEGDVQSDGTGGFNCENEETLIFRRIADQYHQRALQLLTSADPLIAEGRGENRWRYYYSLTKARWFLLRAKVTVRELPVKALEDFTWAGRLLAGAAGNCGKWTDRRLVIKKWWQAFESCIIVGYGNSGPTLMRRMRARLGVDWNLNWTNALHEVEA